MQTSRDVSRYLRPDVALEPLVGGWHAFSMLVAPFSAGLYLERRLLPILQSFLDAPSLHVAKLKDPNMRGGPFVELPEQAAEDAAKMLERDKKLLAPTLKGGKDLQAVQKLLGGLSGGSLAPLYAQLPPSLAGLVELVYGGERAAYVRFFEALTYQSELYRPEAQSFLLSAALPEARPFVMSTPRLPNRDEVVLRVPFDAPLIDRLSSFQPVSVDELMNHVEAANEDRARAALEGLLVGEAFPLGGNASPWTSKDVRVTTVGHASVLLESGGASLLVDPVAPAGAPRADRMTYAELPARIDTVVVTHSHLDHFDLETLIRLRGRVGRVVVPRSSGTSIDPGMGAMLRRLGFNDVVETSDCDTVPVAGGEVMALPFLGEHGDLDVRGKAGFYVHFGGKKLVFAADSKNLDPALYQRLAARIAPLDEFFIGMECEGASFLWAYGSFLASRVAIADGESRRLNASTKDEGLDIVRALRPKRVHVYAMGTEPWLLPLFGKACDEDSVPMQHARGFVEACRAMGLHADHLYGHGSYII